MSSRVHRVSPHDSPLGLSPLVVSTIELRQYGARRLILYQAIPHPHGHLGLRRSGGGHERGLGRGGEQRRGAQHPLELRLCPGRFPRRQWRLGEASDRSSNLTCRWFG